VSSAEIQELRDELARLLAFVGPAPSSESHAHHINEIRDDNRLDNLRWEKSVNQWAPSYYEREAEVYEQEEEAYG